MHEVRPPIIIRKPENITVVAGISAFFECGVNLGSSAPNLIWGKYFGGDQNAKRNKNKNELYMTVPFLYLWLVNISQTA